MRDRSREKSIACLAAVAGGIALLVYLRALSCGFINWDDQEYILNNTAIRALNLKTVIWAFTNYEVGWWFPLTWLTFALDYRFWGVAPFGYHLTNILLHAANTSLVALLAHRLCRDRFAGIDSRLRLLIPLAAALVFAIHPLRVESVAWATERKDVLNGLFSIGSMLCYLEYVARREEGTAWQSRYLGTLLLFVLSLLAKPVSVVIPLLMLVIDRYPLERYARSGFWPLIYEKLPFFAISALLTAFTIYTGMRTNVLPLDLSLQQRVVVSGNALFEYLRLQLFPVGVIPLYVIPSPIPPAFAVKTGLFAAIFVGVLAAGIRRPPLMTIWLCFLIPFLPVLAITQNGIQSHAARFTYLPSISLSIGFSAGVALLLADAGALRRGIVAVGLLLLIVVYGMGTWRMIGVWRDSGSYWTRIIAYQPFDRAYFYRGLFYTDSGQYAAAVEDYTTCLAIAEKEGMPERFNLLAFRGEAWARWGRYEEAVRDFTAAIAVSPHPLYFRHRADALQRLGRLAAAEEDFRRSGTAAGQMQWFQN